MTDKDIQNTLLDRAITNPSGTVTVEWGYQGRKRFGRREIKAARVLANRGILGLVQSTSDALYKHVYGQNGRVYTCVYRLLGGAQ